MKRQGDRCRACGYRIGINHERWCPKLHPEEWSWLVRAKSGPAGSERQFESAVLKDQVELTNLFRCWITHQEDFAAIPLGSFTLEVFRRFRGVEMHFSVYSVSIASGKRELWGNYLSRQEVQSAWEAAGGVYREG